MTSIQGADKTMFLDSENRASEPARELCHLDDVPIINQLPIELLLLIFENALAPWYYSYGPTYYRHLCALTRVCTRWYTIVQHSSQLWTTVTGNIKVKGLKKILERSMGQLIDVEYKPRGGEGLGYPDGHFLKFFDVLGPTAERWRTLVLATRYYWGERPSEFLQFPAPNLERLVFKNHQLWNMEDVEFFGGICPKLRHIRVVSATCKWSQVAFKGLESLDLSKVSFDSVGPILDIVRDIPQLKKLEICNCDVNDVVPTNTRSVSLPNLQFLRAEFDNKSGLISATEEFLKHISAPLQCSLYISVFGIDNEEASIVTAFCDWLLGRQTRAVLEGLERFQLGFDVSEGNMVDSVHFGLFSGSATIKGGIKAFGPQDVLHVLEYIKKMFQESHVSKPFTDLRLSKRGVELLAANEFFTLFKDHPPITRLELDEPVWYVWDASFDDVLGNPGSPFSTIRNLILRPNCGTSQTMTPDKIIDTVLSAMETARARTPLMSERQTKLLDCLELFVEEQNFNRVQPAVKALREDPRIGKVDLYVAL